MAMSTIHSSISARNVRPFEMTARVSDAAVRELATMGFHFDHGFVHEQVKHLFAGDSSFTPSITAPSIPTPVQFLQTWLPGFVKILTAARKIDTLVGIQTVGSWSDYEIVQGVLEPAGTAVEYGDLVNMPMASWNTNFERRSVVRGMLGLNVSILEEERAASMRVSSAQEKRQSTAISLEIFRNAIGFFGWNTGANRTFGFVNDPSLPGYLTAPTGHWATATYLQMVADIRFMVATLQTQSGDQIDAEKVECVLAVPTSVKAAMTVVSDFGNSVMGWLKENYPKIRVESAPELVAVNSGASVAYLFAESVDSSIDGSTDGGSTFVQLVQTKFRTLGVEKRVQSYSEGFSNATAGVLCKRPFAVVRMTGL